MTFQAAEKKNDKRHEGSAVGLDSGDLFMRKHTMVVDWQSRGQHE